MTPQSGQMLSHYRLVEKIGEGGMGEVYLAEDTHLDRRVALKLLPAALTTDHQKIERFEREAKVVASLNHPNIVTIFSVEQAEESRFLTMELVEGETLDHRIAKVGLPLSQVLAIGIDLSDALAAAHDKGVIHRDLKPANIMMTKDRRLKVLDFGLAKLVAEVREDSAASRERTQAATRDAPLTGEGTVLGTVPYMSPEQLAGETVDHRTDIFSLGVVLYELATGRKPFSGKNSAELISSIMRDTPQAVTRINQELPHHLARIIAMCLEKDPGERFQAVLDVRNELRALSREISSGDVPADRSVSQVTMERPGTRRKRVWTLLSAAALLVLGGGIWMARRPGGTEQTMVVPGTGEISSIAVLPFDNTGGSPETEYLSDGITESLINSLAELPDLRVVSRSSVFRYKGRQVDPVEVARELNVEALVTGRAGQRGGMLVVSAELVAAASDAQLWGDQYSRPVADIMEFQEDIARAIAGRLRQRLSREQEAKLSRRYTDSTEAYQLYLKGRYEWNRRTEEGMRQALAFFEQSIEIDPGFALAWAGVADCYATSIARRALGLQTEEQNAKAKAAALKALELDDDLAEAHITLADTLYWGEWDWDGSDREYRLGLDLKPGYATGHSWYAEYLSAVGRHDEAIVEAKKAYELDPLAVIMPFQIGNTYLRAGLFDEAVVWFEKGLAQAPELQWNTFGLGLSYMGLGDEQKAVQRWKDGYSLGDKEELAERLSEAHETEGMRGVWTFWLDLPRTEDPARELEAYASAQLGDAGRAFHVIEQAMNRKEPWVVHIRNAALLEPLHSDSRYAEILRRMDFPE